MSENSQPPGFTDEEILARLGYARERLITMLTENALEATPALVNTLLHRLVSKTYQAVAEELDEALRNLRFPETLTERQAHALRSQIQQEIAKDDSLRLYFGYCCGIEVEQVGSIRYQIHMYFDAYGKHYGEMWVRDEATWKKEAARIRQEVEEERG